MDTSTLDNATRYRFAAITLPATVTTLANSGGGGAFASFASLKSISAPGVITVEILAFSNCTTLTSISLPAATTIGGYAFSNCTALTSISLPVALTFGEQALYNCRALTTVSLPAATTIGTGAFNDCIALTEVRLGATAPTTLDYDIFTGTKGSAAPSRTITIKFPSASGVSSSWVSDNSSHWGSDLPDGGIVQGTY
jgi:hypothetical protein